MRFLLVEDEAVLREVVHDSLTQAGHRVDAASTAEQARYLWRVQPFDAVLLDLNLPDASGLDVLREQRKRGDRTPVLVLTARNRTDERIAGLDAGADDYLGKPFDLAEVEARLRALVRRAQGAEDRTEVGGLLLDRRARRLFLRGAEGSALVEMELPAREFEVLLELMTPPGRVVNKQALSDKLSGFDDALAHNALEAFVSRLRRKLQGSGATIRTLRGLGYLIEPERDSPA
jgi:DNA-binding response OmpR family regulator